MQRLVRAPLNLYFERTPIGRIINRLSKDMTKIDKMIPNIIPWIYSTTFTFINDVVVTVYGAGYFITPAIFLFLIFAWSVQAKFLRLQRELIRL